MITVSAEVCCVERTRLIFSKSRLIKVSHAGKKTIMEAYKPDCGFCGAARSGKMSYSRFESDYVRIIPREDARDQVRLHLVIQQGSGPVCRYHIYLALGKSGLIERTSDGRFRPLA